MDDDRLSAGLVVGGVLGLVTFTLGMVACQKPHFMPIHHGFLGLVSVGTGLVIRDSFYSPIMLFSGLGMMFSDLQDVPEWLNFGSPPEELVYDDTTLSY